MLQPIWKKYHYYMKKQHLNSEMKRKACKIKITQMNEMCMILLL